MTLCENTRIVINQLFCFSVQAFAGSLSRGMDMRTAALCSNTFLVIHPMFEQLIPTFII